MSRPMIFVATPVEKPFVEWRLDKMHSHTLYGSKLYLFQESLRKASAQLWAAGGVPIVPALNSWLLFDYWPERQCYYEGYMQLLELLAESRIEYAQVAFLRLWPQVESKGAQREEVRAMQLGITCFKSLRRCVAWLKSTS